MFKIILVAILFTVLIKQAYVDEITARIIIYSLTVLIVCILDNIMDWCKNN